MKIPSIHINNAELSYGGIPIFSKINLTLPAGKWIGLLGPSGIGKSSLLRLIAGLLSPPEISHGLIATDNNIPVSAQVSYMAQTDLLLPWLSAVDNAILGFTLRASTRSEMAAARARATALLQQVGLGAALNLYPQQLSSGMRQRVALVRTLMEDKAIILMDEPFAALDAITRYKLQNLAAELLSGKTVLFITHDPIEALRLSDEIYIMLGKPATLKPIATLNSPKPRELTDPETSFLQATLFHELTEAAGETT